MISAQDNPDTTQESPTNTHPPIIKTPKNKIRESGFEFEVIKGFEAGWSIQRIHDHLKDVCHFTASCPTIDAYKKKFYDPAVKHGQDAASIQIRKMIENAEIDKLVTETSFVAAMKKADRLKSGIVSTELTIKKIEENEDLYSNSALLLRHAAAIESLKNMQGELDELLASSTSPEAMKRLVKEQVAQKMLTVYHNFICEHYSREKADEMLETFLLEIKYI